MLEIVKLYDSWASTWPYFHCFGKKCSVFQSLRSPCACSDWMGVLICLLDINGWQFLYRDIFCFAGCHWLVTWQGHNQSFFGPTGPSQSIIIEYPPPPKLSYWLMNLLARYFLNGLKIWNCMDDNVHNACLGGNTFGL